MFQFVINGRVIATADSPEWLDYLFTQYPRGQVVEAQAPQPVVTGAQTL